MTVRLLRNRKTIRNRIRRLSITIVRMRIGLKRGMIGRHNRKIILSPTGLTTARIIGLT
jgi:hypothetical protein